MYETIHTTRDLLDEDSCWHSVEWNARHWVVHDVDNDAEEIELILAEGEPMRECDAGDERPLMSFTFGELTEYLQSPDHSVYLFG